LTDLVRLVRFPLSVGLAGPPTGSLTIRQKSLSVSAGTRSWPAPDVNSRSCPGTKF